MMKNHQIRSEFFLGGFFYGFITNTAKPLLQ